MRSLPVICARAATALHLTGTNIGNLLNTANLTWGWFEGGFDLTITNPNGTTGCKRTHTSLTGAFAPKVDYIPHHQPFQFYASTANPTHQRPTSVSAIGTTDAANHQYDSHDFFDALAAGNLPNVVFLKAPGYQDGHAGYSSPLDEQVFIADTINQLEESKFWNTTAVIIEYDDSDGWYDHQMGPIIIHSQANGCGWSTGRRPDRTQFLRQFVQWPASAGTMRLRTAASVPGNFALGQDQLRRSHGDRSKLSDCVHRAELGLALRYPCGRWRSRLLRSIRGTDHQHVRLHAEKRPRSARTRSLSIQLPATCSRRSPRPAAATSPDRSLARD